MLCNYCLIARKHKNTKTTYRKNSLTFWNFSGQDISYIKQSNRITSKINIEH